MKSTLSFFVSVCFGFGIFVISMIVGAVIATGIRSVAAQDAPKLTIGDCLTIRSGLIALTFVGQLPNGPVPPDAKPYKLGALRGPIGLRLADLEVIANAYAKSDRELAVEIAGGKGKIEDGSSQAVELATKRQEMLDQTCNVTLTHIALSDLRLGDGPDQNQIPFQTIAALGKMLDRDK
jgi:hypothetical protein